MFALVTDQGTAASETALCNIDVLNPDARLYARAQTMNPKDIPLGAAFVDCTGNEELVCVWCGREDNEYAENAAPDDEWQEGDL